MSNAVTYSSASASVPNVAVALVPVFIVALEVTCKPAAMILVFAGTVRH
jgi:hypothetical protein